MFVSVCVTLCLTELLTNALLIKHLSFSVFNYAGLNDACSFVVFIRSSSSLSTSKVQLFKLLTLQEEVMKRMWLSSERLRIKSQTLSSGFLVFAIFGQYKKKSDVF